MKTFILNLVMLSALAALGCKGRIAAQTLHVTAASPHEPVDVTGVYEGREFALSVSRADVPLYVAYYEPIGVEDVGKDFHAVLAGGELKIDVPGRGTVSYSVRAAKEVQK